MDQRLVRMLREAGVRVTAPRLAVLTAVQEHPHADTETVFEAARELLGGVSLQSVYDGLKTLTDAGLVRRVHPPGSVARYDPRIGDNHHHLVCRQCRTMIDIDCAIGAAPCLTPNDDHGFVIDEAEVIYWGFCPSCATGRQSVSRPTAACQ